MNRLLLLCMLSGAALAQPAADTAKASITGMVKDSVAGLPLAKYNVSTYINVTWFNETLLQTPETKQINSVTDEQGAYKLSDLPPGLYRISVRNAQVPGLNSISRQVLVSGRDLDHVDFAVEVEGAITGKVLDENREPVPNMGVRLVSREYYAGTLGYYVKSVAITDDRGIYTFKSVQAGHPYLVMAEKDTRRSAVARAETPLDPKLRRRVPMPTFYPNSPDPQGASPITVRPRETREGVNIEVKKSPSYCADGTVASLGGPGAFNVGAVPVQPAFSTSSTGGLAGFAGGAKTGPDGKFRTCDLSPGAYRLSAFDDDRNNPNRAMLVFDILDRDLHNLSVTIGAGTTLEGEVVWDGAAPATPPTAKVSLNLTALMRSSIGNERSSARADIPGTFSIPGMLPSDYALRAFVNAPGFYLADITYGGQSVLYAPVRLGTALGNTGLRVTVARDGARLNARVTDKDGNPLPDTRVLVVPAAISSEAMLQAAMVVGQTDQTGMYKSHPLRPGKYLVLATPDKVAPTPESIDNFWRSRNRFQEVDLPPNGAAEVKLTPVSLREAAAR